MAAVAAKLLCSDNRDNGYREQNIQRPKTGSIDDNIPTQWSRRCESQCRKRDLETASDIPAPPPDYTVGYPRPRQATLVRVAP